MRSVGHVRLHGLIARSAHITSLVFRIVLLVGGRPWLVALLRRQRLPGTLLAYRFGMLVAVEAKT